MDYIIEALRFFENIKPALEGVVATGTVLASSTKFTIYVVKKGAKIFPKCSGLMPEPSSRTSMLT